VFLTGASRGIGKAMAMAYAKAGASVIGIAARSDLDEVKKEIEEAASSAGREIPNVVTVSIDVQKSESVQKAVEKITPHFQGRIDILVSNAGYMETWMPIADATIDDWWNSWEVNIKGQFLVWKAMLPLLLADESSLKTVVNLSSIGAQMSSPGASAYQTAKFALLRLTEFLNAEYGDKGLIAYCMHPGAVPTDLAWKMPDFVKGNLIDTPELMADTVVYLTQKRREWLRGRYLSCNWDMQELFAKKEEIVERDLLKMRMVV
jgi:NAD(P)-dependent dehydrogenase (short-subunit alcohol dehydrogenase family)